MDETAAPQLDAIDLTAEIVAAYVANNPISPSELPRLLTAVHAAVIGLEARSSAPPDEPEVDKATPAQIRKSITPDAVISFIDGKPYKALKRHLGAHGYSQAVA